MSTKRHPHRITETNHPVSLSVFIGANPAVAVESHPVLLTVLQAFMVAGWLWVVGIDLWRQLRNQARTRRLMKRMCFFTAIMGSMLAVVHFMKVFVESVAF